MSSALAEALKRCSVIQMDLDTTSLPSCLLPTLNGVLSTKMGYRENNSVWCRGLETLTFNLKAFCEGDGREEMGLNIFLESFFFSTERHIYSEAPAKVRDE